MVLPFKKLLGIEYLSYLHELAEQFVGGFEDKYSDFKEKYADLLAVKDLGTYTLINGDFFKEDWSEASFVLINSTCFSTEMMEQIGDRLNSARKGCIVVTFTKRLVNLDKDKWRVLNGFKRNMSWGIATIFLHQKVD